MGGRGRSKNEPTAPDRVRTTLGVQRQALELRSAGATFREIGTALGIDHTWARTLVIKALKESTYEGADHLRRLEGQRLDRLQRAAWAKAIGGDLKAIDTVRRLMERRSALFGLDASHDLAERELALAERQGQLIAEGVLRMLDTLGLGQDPTARDAAATMLADLSRRELTEAVLDVDYVDEDGTLIEGAGT